MNTISKHIIGLCVLLVTQVLTAQQKPNILIIHTDDLGYYDISFTGSQLNNTPNIDQLAKEAVSFTHAYSSYPRCTPSRYGMITGTYPVNENKGYLGGIPESKNFIKQFKKAGYTTSYVGKWHLGEDDSKPTSFGFDHSYAAGRAGGVGSRFYPFNKRKGKPAKEIVEDVEQDGKEGDYISDLLTDASIDFINKVPKGKPFLAILAYYSVHTPLEAKEEDKKRNQKQLKSIDFGDTPEFIKEGAGRRKMRQDDPKYAGMVENVDENVGKILKLLKAKGISDNTIVVFSSDHGGLSNDGHKGHRQLATTNLPLKAGKGWLYEGGIRVPLFIKWSAQLQPKIDDKSIVVGMDLFPTLLDLTDLPKMNGIDGISYKSSLEGTSTLEKRTVFWHSKKARPHSTGDYKTSAIRDGDYKLVHFFDKNIVELYNLKEDIREQHDLSKKLPNRTKIMMEKLNSWKKAYLIPSKLNVLKKKPKKKK